MQVIKIIFYDSKRERDREKWVTIETQTVNRRGVCACASRDEKSFSLILLGLKKKLENEKNQHCEWCSCKIFMLTLEMLGV